MGSNIDLIREREDILDEILFRLNNWDCSPEAGVKIIEDNNKGFKRLKDIEDRLNGLVDEQTGEKYQLLLKKQNEFVEQLGKVRELLIKEREQFTKKDKIKNNYIAKKVNPVFIDKDL